MRIALLAFTLLSALPLEASAQSAFIHGLGRARLVAPSDDISWMDGGLGKFRYGAADDNPLFHVSDLYLEGGVLATSELSFTATIKHDPEQLEAVDIVEAYVRYKPVSSSPWRWSVKAGAFFPPISFENNEIGWTSSYSITPSAINSWVGEELRSVGVEGEVEWRSMDRTISVIGSVYGWNDPAGILLAMRGWGMTDRVTGVFDRIRLPDHFANRIGADIPLLELEVLEIDDKPGWYAGLQWEERNGVRFRLMRYDNRADPAATEKDQTAWWTPFWAAGAEFPIGEWLVILQGMKGHTDVDLPSGRYLATDFSSVFALATRDVGDVRFTGRAELFRTDEVVNGTGQGRKEHGGAFTFAVRWFVNDHIRLSGETIFLKTNRPERLSAGLDPDAEEIQTQVAIDFEF